MSASLVWTLRHYLEFWYPGRTRRFELISAALWFMMSFQRGLEAEARSGNFIGARGGLFSARRMTRGGGQLGDFVFFDSILQHGQVGVFRSLILDLEAVLTIGAGPGRAQLVKSYL